MKPPKRVIDRSKYQEILSKPMSGFMGDAGTFTPEILSGHGYEYHSGSEKTGDLVAKKGNEYYLFNQQGNARGLVNIGDPFRAPASASAPKPKPVIIDPMKVSGYNGIITDKLSKGGKVKGYSTAGEVTDDRFKPVVSDPNPNDQYKPVAPPVKVDTKPPKVSGNTWMTAANVAGQAMGSVNPEDTEMKYGSSDYFDKRNANLKQGQGVANTVAAIPIVGAFKSIGEGGQKMIAPKDAYGVSDSNNAAVAVGGFLNPLESTTSAFKDISKGKFTGQTAANLLLPGVGAVMMNDEKKREREKLKAGQEEADAEELRLANNRRVQETIAKRENNLGYANGGELPGTGNNDLMIFNNKGDKLLNFSISEAKNRHIDQVNRKFYQDVSKEGLTPDEYMKKYPDEATYRDENLRRFIKHNKAKGKTPMGGASYSDGGKVIGKGTGTSDSIKAKIEPNSFVIPAKNEKVAELLRKLILKTPPKPAKLKQENGVNIKLSDGEHLFTPEEKLKLKANGVNLNALAPDAENTDEMANGGTPPKRHSTLTRTTTTQKKYLIDPRSIPSADELKRPPVKSPPRVKEQPEYLAAKTATLPVPVREEELRGNQTIVPVAAETTTDGGNDKKFNAGDGLNQAINYGLPAIQTAVGLKALNDAGKRPVDKLSDDYLNSISTAKKNVDLANANAQYGFTPEERFALAQQNQGLLNSGRFAARNYSGGSASNALTNERVAINDSFGRGLDQSIANRKLQLAKQDIAYGRQGALDNLISGKVEMSRRLFNDKMQGWQQNQATGANLVHTGIDNLIGANRYNQELNYMKDRDSKYNYNY